MSFKEAQKSVKDRQYVVGTGCIRNGVGKMCYNEKERRETWKMYMEK